MLWKSFRFSKEKYRMLSCPHKGVFPNGYGLYRTNIAFMDAVGETYGPTIQNVFRKIKLALDPNGILSPGKAGIAP